MRIDPDHIVAVCRRFNIEVERESDESRDAFNKRYKQKAETLYIARVIPHNYENYRTGFIKAMAENGCNLAEDGENRLAYVFTQLRPMSVDDAIKQMSEYTDELEKKDLNQE